MSYYYFEGYRYQMNKKIILTALLFGIFSIVLGAFGAHSLKKMLTIEQLNSFETGVRYLMYHSLFLLFVGNLTLISEKVQKWIFYVTVLGVLLFCGSLFLLTTKTVTGIDFKFLGPVTPIGGLLLIVAWSWVFIKIMRKN